MIKFRGSDHTYWVNDTQVPGVTSVIKDQLAVRVPVAERVMREKGELGELVHDATALDAAGTLDESSIDPEVAPYMEGWRKFMRDFKPAILATEEIVYHPVYRYAGKLDHVMQINGGLAIVDKKTGVLDDNNEVQTAAYLHAYNACTHLYRPNRQYVLYLREGTYQLHEVKDSRWPIFLAALTAYRWRYK